MTVKKQHLNPKELFSTRGLGFSHVVTAAPGVSVHISGQVAWNAERKLIGGDDLGQQAEQALKNLRIALEAAGATPSDVVSVRVYIVDYKPEFAAVLGPLFDGFFSESPAPASTWVGVAALAAPDFRIEIEASAVISA